MEKQNRIYGFPPIVDENSKVLILGSMPSVQSLEKEEYYGNQQNYFWPMLYALFQEDYTLNYQEKKQFILRHQLALWDVVASCERNGSLDSNIIQETTQNFQDFFVKYPQIKVICFNGGKAYQLFRKYYKDILQTKEYYQLPSTSPAYTLAKEEKLKKWQIICSLVK